MKPGQEINCPHCGRNSFLKKVTITEGWTKKGEILACTSCSAKIADLNIEQKTEEERKSSAVSSLASLFKDDSGLKKPRIEAKDEEKIFCKDCKNFIKHPFADKCGLTEKHVNPMDDCDKFERRSSTEK
ncbi:MAG TPA: hypothetical protein PK821_01175 [Victivallales bacterium]|nr:hypothetical protein [Victivallales bacterium]